MEFFVICLQKGPSFGKSQLLFGAKLANQNKFQKAGNFKIKPKFLAFGNLVNCWLLSDVKLWFGLVSFLARVFSLEFDLLLVYFTQLEIVFASSEELLRRLTSRIKFRFLLLDVSRQRLIIRSKLSAIFGNVKKCQTCHSLDLIIGESLISQRPQRHTV